MSSVVVEKFGVVGKNFQIAKRCDSTKNQPMLLTQVSVSWFSPFRLCSNSPQ